LATFGFLSFVFSGLPGFVVGLVLMVIWPVLTGLSLYVALLLPLEALVKAASTVILTSYVLTNISVIILRESRLSNYQPSFKSPLYPWTQLFGVVIFTYFI